MAPHLGDVIIILEVGRKEDPERVADFPKAGPD
jgi:hypothetical protein